MSVHRISHDPPPVVSMSEDCLAAELTRHLDELIWLVLAAPEHRRSELAGICTDVFRLVGDLNGEE